MIYSPLWTVSILGISWLIPRIIPVFRNNYNKIHETIKNNTVFRSECVSEIHQTQLDLLDRTIGQLVNSVCQLLIVVWAIYNLIIADRTDSLNEYVVGFYLYDIIHLCSNHYGKTQRMYIVHHLLTIGIIAYVQYVATGYSIFGNINYILLELSSTSINVANMTKFFNPVAKYNITISGINVNIYFITRIVAFPLNLLLLSYMIYESDSSTKYVNIPPITLLSILFCVCVGWFIALVKKHEESRKKWLL
jgi:hypothetical protein